VGRHQDEALDAAVEALTGVDRCNRGAVAVTEQDSAPKPDRLERRGQAEPRLALHVIEPAGKIDRIGPAVARARIGERAPARRSGQPRRKVAPQRDAAEPLVQHDDCRRLFRRRAIGDRLKPLAIGEDFTADACDPSKTCHGAKAATTRRR
jgi:hypothetical protein